MLGEGVARTQESEVLSGLAGAAEHAENRVLGALVEGGGVGTKSHGDIAEEAVVLLASDAVGELGTVVYVSVNALLAILKEIGVVLLRLADDEATPIDSKRNG
jgi:hypothetical protein